MADAVKKPALFVARAVIEFETPFIVGGGKDDLFFDDVFVSDANGLPALPGSSLAGILRHAWKDAGYGDGNDLFGFQSDDKGSGSPLSVSWGCIHDSKNVPVEGRIEDDVRLTDPVLAEAVLMTARDHVRIGHKGATESGGKFDERSVSAGHRFTFELSMDCAGIDRETRDWSRILALLTDASLRIGGKTRRGYGKFKVVTLMSDDFDLSKKDGFDRYAAHPVHLSAKAALRKVVSGESAMPGDAKQVPVATLRLKPEGFWMIGGGVDEEGQVDLAPLKANRIVWKNDVGTVAENQVVVPGSSVKGALSHRVAFHYNRLAGNFASAERDPAECTGDRNSAVRDLFGFSKDGNEGQRGRVLIGDLFVDDPGTPKILNHVSIDRFTGGALVLQGALFDEKPFWKGEGFRLDVAVAESGKVENPIVRKALACALEDLASGRLALGAGSGRGNGFFRADDGVEWNEAGKQWIAEVTA